MNIAVQLAGASFELCSIKEGADSTFTVPGVQEIICPFEESFLCSLTVSSVSLLRVTIKTFCIFSDK
jgi:hypothetical protein